MPEDNLSEKNENLLALDLEKIEENISQMKNTENNSKMDDDLCVASTSQENMSNVDKEIEEKGEEITLENVENQLLKSNDELESSHNSNNKNLNEESKSCEHNSEGGVLNANPESTETLLERVQSLESKLTQQNQQILGLAIALKMAKDETDDVLDGVVLHRLNVLQSITSLTKSLVPPSSMTDMCCTRPAEFIWNIKEIKQKMKSNEFELVSEDFQLNGYPNKAKARIQLKADGMLYTSLFIVETPEDEPLSFFKLKMLPTVYYVLKSQFDGKEYDIVRPLVYVFGSSVSPGGFCYEYKAFSRFFLSNRFSLHNRRNAVTIEFHVEPPPMVYQVFSYNKVLTWAVDRYKKRRKRAGYSGQGFHTSPYFYCGEVGYRMQVHMLLNGSGDFLYKGLTAHVLFLTGEYDRHLPKSFMHQTTITLVNQKHPGKHITKRVIKNIDKETHYKINLGTFKEIGKLIIKDTLHYKVTVVPVSIE